ncbi:hypothetical protein OAN307_c33710 [Octadecabacter antarcticus 307]|uniref:Uncharacterized protein n=1 Tax=Octadecabacter antarcticus 307 TaxID=391626 RepID=M9RGE1_9RHOB|nr:hypothetical protein OAN307_c33710 [Octadecabacter antarcticus 307]
MLLAEALNLGISKMAEAFDPHDYFQIAHFPNRCWFIENPPPATPLKIQAARPRLPHNSCGLLMAF